MYAEITHFSPYKLPLNKNAPFALHWFEKYKYLREDHLTRQTLVQLSSSYSKSFWRMSCFIQKGQSSGIAIIGYKYAINQREEWYHKWNNIGVQRAGGGVATLEDEVTSFAHCLLRVKACSSYPVGPEIEGMQKNCTLISPSVLWLICTYKCF